MTKRNKRAGFLQSGGLNLQVFTTDELNEIHLATLEVLHDTGINVNSPKALEIYAKGGAIVDAEKGRVRFPGRMIEEALSLAPPKFIAYGRSPKHDVVMENNRVNYTSFTEGVEIFDLLTGELRETTIQDLADLSRMVDGLDILDVACTIVNGSDVSQKLNGLYNALTVLLNTTKPFDCGPNSSEECDYIYRIAEALIGPEQMAARPPVYFGGCPISPLTISPELADIIIFAAEKKLPCEVLSMAMAGGSTPVHLAGTLVVHNAEVLAGITLAQLVNPGNPVVYGTSTTAMNLRTATATVGSPELAQISAAVAALSQHYKLPCMVAGS